MLSLPARAIDQALLRLTVRRAQLRRRTLWPDPEALRRLRDGVPPDIPLHDPGAPHNVELRPGPGPESASQSAPGRQRFAFASSPPYGMAHDTTVQGELFAPDPAHDGATRGAVVVVPGAFTGLNKGFENGFYGRLGRRFAQAGIAAAVLALPLHKGRAAIRADGRRERSGHDLLHGDIFTHARAIGQAVRDVRATLGWLSAEHGSVGLWGISLGALVHSLVLPEDGRPAFAVLAQPPVGRRRLFDSPLLAVWASQLRDSGVTPADVDAVFAPIAPRRPPQLAPQRILIQAGRHDRVARPEGVEELRNRWGSPPVSWYAHSHTSIFLSRRRLIEEGVSFAAAMLSQDAGQTGANEKGSG